MLVEGAAGAAAVEAVAGAVPPAAMTKPAVEAVAGAATMTKPAATPAPPTASALLGA